MAATSSESDGATAPSTHHFPPEHISSSSSSSLHFLAPSPPAAIRRRRIRVLTGGIGIHQWPGKLVGNDSCKLSQFGEFSLFVSSKQVLRCVVCRCCNRRRKKKSILPFLHPPIPDTLTVLYIIGACQCVGEEVGVSLCLRESVGRVSPEKSFLFFRRTGGAKEEEEATV